MKRLIIACSLAACLGMFSVSAKEIRKVELVPTPHLHCSGCENKIKNFFKFEKGIKKIETSIPNQLVTITYDADKTSEEKIIESFGKINYEVKKAETSTDVKDGE